MPIAQRYCKMAIAKSDHTLLFPKVDPSASSAGASAAIHDNIAYLHLHFLGEPASAEDVEAIYSELFQPLESASDPQTAWAGVCSYFIRHPKWIFY